MNLGREMTASLEGKYSLSTARGTLGAPSGVSLAMQFHTASSSGLQHNTETTVSYDKGESEMSLNKK